MLHPRKDYQRIQDPAGLIPEDEPVFLLRAQDEAAAQTVRFWADLNMKLDGNPVLSSFARNHASLMDAWSVHKLADLPTELPASQTGIEELKQKAEGLRKDLEDLAEQSAEQNEAQARAAAAAERVVDQPEIKPWKQESKPGAGVVSEPAKSESEPGAGVVSEPEKSQNKDGSGVV